MANFDSAINKLLQHEGGYVNHKADKGGETYRGITRKNHPTWLGWEIVDKKPRKKNELIPELETMVRNFYKRYYWDAIKADNICNDRIASFLFDWYVNSGAPAVKAIQKIVGVEQDGIIGKNTLHGINNYDNGLFEKLKMARIGFVKRIVENDPSQQVFLQGWINRINSFG